MNVMPTMSTNAGPMEQPRARMGLIIPSVNTYSEPQFNHFAPEARARNPDASTVLVSGFRIAASQRPE